MSVRRKLPKGLSAEEGFRFYMPEDPPPTTSETEGCWDWRGPMGELYGEFRTGRQYRAHRVSYEMFVALIPDGLLVRHTCDRYICVQPRHLLVGTIADNSRDAAERGRMPHGEAHTRAKITERDVLWIRENAGKVRQSEMAEVLGIDQGAISRIISRKSWRHVL